MLENAKVTRATYKLPKGEEAYVHYTIEKIAFNSKTGQKISRQEVVKTNPKMFDNVKRNLELQGFTVNILFHPDGKYNEEIIVETPEERMRREIEAEVRAEFEKKFEEATTDTEKETADTEEKKIGRPQKEN